MSHICFKLYCSTFHPLSTTPQITVFGNRCFLPKTLHISPMQRFPRASALKLPNNVVDINATEMSRFGPTRERDISGPVINSHFAKINKSYEIDITVQSDPRVNKYDCRGAVNLSSSMQSNVPNPFSGNHSHLGMPGSQWVQGYKYLSDHLHCSHYLTLRNLYREGQNTGRKGEWTSVRNMSTGIDNPPLSSKEKLKNAVKQYGSTVIVFHISISLLSLGVCYLLVSGGVDMVAVLKFLNFSEGTISKATVSNAGTFVLAYAVHKCFAPVRIAITVSATPFVVKYLRSIGVLKHNVSK